MTSIDASTSANAHRQDSEADKRTRQPPHTVRPYPEDRRYRVEGISLSDSLALYARHLAAEAAAASTAQPTEASVEVELRVAALTDVGLVRKHNEDDFVVANLATSSQDMGNGVVAVQVRNRGAILAVCDGMGGAAAGEVASAMAVDTLVEELTRGDAPREEGAFAKRLVSAIEEAGRRIYETAHRDRSKRGMGTTATVAGVFGGTLLVGQVGDSRAYVLREHTLTQVTKDQSLVNQLLEAGQITEAEAEVFEHSNIILQALGTSQSVAVALTRVELCKGDRVLVCSDGLSGLAAHEDLVEVLIEHGDPAVACAKLVGLAKAAGGHDNITLVIADVAGGDLPEPATRPVEWVAFRPPSGKQDDDLQDQTTGRRSAFAKSLGEADTDPGIGVAKGLAVEAKPPETDEVDTVEPMQSRPRRWLWPAVALGASVLGFALFSRSSTKPEPVTQATAPNAPATGDAPAATEPVAVTVLSRMEGSLYVQGRYNSRLVPGGRVTLELTPGEYALEGRQLGQNTEHTVITVKPGSPLQVVIGDAATNP